MTCVFWDHDIVMNDIGIYIINVSELNIFEAFNVFLNDTYVVGWKT